MVEKYADHKELLDIANMMLPLVEGDENMKYMAPIVTATDTHTVNIVSTNIVFAYPSLIKTGWSFIGCLCGKSCLHVMSCSSRCQGRSGEDFSSWVCIHLPRRSPTPSKKSFMSKTERYAPRLVTANLPAFTLPIPSSKRTKPAMTIDNL